MFDAPSDVIAFLVAQCLGAGLYDAHDRASGRSVGAATRFYGPGALADQWKFYGLDVHKPELTLPHRQALADSAESMRLEHGGERSSINDIVGAARAWAADIRATLVNEPPDSASADDAETAHLAGSL
ncbi:MAG: hypothetical protein H7099_11650 [Gemmatimonadaceae bacterium]|nr:hypothetical protein [Gemmatimonadaceae bacterium]